jgi:hypothetical protein
VRFIANVFLAYILIDQNGLSRVPYARNTRPTAGHPHRRQRLIIAGTPYQSRKCELVPELPVTATGRLG